MALPISNRMLYVGATALGATGAVATSLALAGIDGERRAAHDARVDAMPADELRRAVRDGLKPPIELGAMVPAAAGGALAGAGIVYGATGGFINLFASLTGGELVSLRPGGALLWGGVGAMAGTAVVQGVQALRDR